MYAPVTVGDTVSAVHSDSGLLLRGQVLTLETSFPNNTPSYRVQFEYPVMFTGVIKDEEIAVHGELLSLLLKPDHAINIDSEEQIKKIDQQLLSAHEIRPETMPEIDAKRKWEHAATLHYFLDRKEYLMETLKALNSKMENTLSLSKTKEAFVCGSRSSDNVVTSYFSEQYQWVLNNISRTNNIIQQLLKQFDSDCLNFTNHGAPVFGSSDSSSEVSAAWREEFKKLECISLSTKQAKDAALHSNIDVSNSDSDQSISLLRTFICCLMVLKKYFLEEFCQPKELCDFLVRKVDEFKQVLPVRAFIDKIEAICFGVS